MINKKNKLFIFIILTAFNLIGSNCIFAQNSLQTKVYVFSIDNEIAKPVWLKTKKALKESVQLKSDVLLIKMNTYGGRLDFADSIRTGILKSKIPVWVHINTNAASAGALISIACDSIYMSEGANIGAATVVNQTGEQLPDKYQSYMRSIMRSTAEANKRNPDIAQAMVDPRIKVEGVNDSGQVVTFTTTEAIKHNYCNAKANTIEEVMQAADVKNYVIHEQQLTFTDKTIGFLTHPMVAGILIVLIIAGIYFEFQSPGAAFPILVAAIAASLYFAPHYIEGLAANWEIIIFVVGVLLLAIEIFAIPGFGVAGISGIFLMIMGLTLAMIDNVFFTFNQNAGQKIAESFFIVIIAAFIAIISSIYFTKKLFSGRTIFGRLALESVQLKEQGYSVADSEFEHLVGSKGVCHSMLRPGGKVMVNGMVYDAIALSGYIEKDVPVIITGYQQSQLIVTKAV